MEQVFRKEKEEYNILDPSIKWIVITETLTKNGVEYARRWLQRDTEIPHFIADELKKTGGQSDIPDVLCGDCQGENFKIYFGNYTVYAECAHCGKLAEIYSG